VKERSKFQQINNIFQKDQDVKLKRFLQLQNIIFKKQVKHKTICGILNTFRKMAMCFPYIMQKLKTASKKSNV